MNLYRQALATILNRPLDGMYLVFLTPRIVHLIH
jgi:hypothetical protein